MNEVKRLIEKQYKDISGSRAFNRLTIQVSYAIKLLIDLYQCEDFIIFMDYIDDVSILKISNGKETLTTYQIKTKKEGNDFTLAFAIKDKWFHKMFKNKVFYNDNVDTLNIVSNVNIKNNVPIFNLERANFEVDMQNAIGSDGKPKTNNLLKIKEAIAKEEKIAIDDVDLSKFYFIKTDLHIDCHKNLALQKFSEFISNINHNAKYKTIKAFFNTLYTLLENKFSKELDPRNDKIEEIIQEKGYTKKEFSSSLIRYLDISIPTNSELFQYFEIMKPRERKIISDARVKYLMDLGENSELFKMFIKIIEKYIQDNQDIDDYQIFIDELYDKLLYDKNISTIYKSEGYIKFALLILLYKKINGDINEKSNF